MKTILSFLFSVMLVGNAISQDKISKFIANDALEYGQYIIAPDAIKYGNYDRGLYPGAVELADGFFDYMTNGQNNTNIWVWSDTVVITWFGCDSTDPTGVTSRVAYYAYSSDAGATWNGPYGVQSLPELSAYPEIHPFFDAFGRNVAVSGRKYNPGSAGGAWTEAFFGLGSFTGVNVPGGGADYFGATINNNEMGGVYNLNVAGIGELHFIKYNFATSSMGTDQVIVPAGLNTDENIRYRLNGDETGNNLIVIWWNSTTGAQQMVYKTSTDAGSTWGTNVVVQQSLLVNGVINGDTCGPWFGMDAAYKPGTSEYGIAWSTLYPTLTGMSSGDPQGCKILYYSPSVNGGIPVEVAGSSNMQIISDPSLFDNRIGQQVGVTPVSHPSI